MENEKKNLEEVLDKFSIFGRYHLQFLFFAMFAYFNCSMFGHNYVFAIEDSKYRCIEEDFTNNTCGGENEKRCSQWSYDNPNSFVAEFELACQDWKRTLVGTAFGFGSMVGALIIGPLSDRLGRKFALIVTGLSGAVFGVAKSFSHSYWLYVSLECLGAMVGSNYSPFYVLNLEIVSVKKRVIFHFLCHTGSAFGGIMLATTAWYVPHWRNFLRVIYTPAFLYILYIILIDESPRWMLTKGKKDKAIAILEKMAVTNKIKLDQDYLNEISVETVDKATGIVDVLKMTLKSVIILKRFLVCLLWWLSITFVFHGLMINSVSLQGNKYMNYGSVELVHLFGKVIITFIMHNYKRRNPLICTLFISAILCFVQSFIPSDVPWITLAVYMCITLTSTFLISILEMYTSELFPTYTRNSMYGLCSGAGKIGVILAPQIPLLRAYWSHLPTLVFGLASLVAGLAALLVPDTAEEALPDTVQDAERLEKIERRNTDDRRNKGDDKRYTGDNGPKGADNLGMTSEI